jgi:histidyl-tRNA synthetase
VYNSYRINKVIFIGKEEVKKGKFKVKDMRTGKEEWKGM